MKPGWTLLRLLAWRYDKRMAELKERTPPPRPEGETARAKLARELRQAASIISSEARWLLRMTVFALLAIVLGVVVLAVFSYATTTEDRAAPVELQRVEVQGRSLTEPASRQARPTLGVC